MARARNSFRFSTELGDNNVDRIRDFTVGDDLILLAQDIFSEIEDMGALAFDAFTRNKAGVARDAEDRIIYDTNDGTLSYDADGTGDGDAIVFARLSSGLNLSSDDFFVI